MMVVWAVAFSLTARNAPVEARPKSFAALLGLGNGAVFKLVPQYFPADTGTVTGLVGATGGIGGFFPPLLLGFFRDSIRAVWPGFVLLAVTALVLWRVNARVFLRMQKGHHEAALPGAIASGVIFVACAALMRAATK